MKNEELWNLNFNKLLILKEGYDPSNYSFDDYERCNHVHPIRGFCTYCEDDFESDQRNINRCMAFENPESVGKYCVSCGKRKDFSLQNISHGSHTDDFLEASSNPIETTGWHDEGVIFLMESPSIDYGIYEKRSWSGHEKRPAKQWYWIHSRQETFNYPNKFRGGEYGKLVVSAISTFRLKNAYLTNLVKCGMNNEDGKEFVGIGCYNHRVIKNCFERYLLSEINAMQTKVIFAFGSKVYNKINELLADAELESKKPIIIGLPHPAGQRRGFKDDYYQTLYFHLIMKGLYDADIIRDDQEIKGLINTFLKTDLWSQTRT